MDAGAGSGGIGVSYRPAAASAFRKYAFFAFRIRHGQSSTAFVTRAWKKVVCNDHDPCKPEAVRCKRAGIIARVANAGEWDNAVNRAGGWHTGTHHRLLGRTATR